MTVVCIGDSITAGQYLDDPTKAWPALLGAVNKGVSNDTTRLGLERFPADVQQSGANVCVIQFGHNDANRWQTDHGLPRVSREAYRANLDEMIWRCNAFEIRPVLATITPTSKDSGYNRDLDDYNRTLLEVAASRNVSVIDVRRLFYSWGSLRSGRELSSLLLDDGLHLSAAGHKLYADIVRTALS